MKRKAKNKFAKKNLDLMKPIPFDSLGGEDDPCFGKLHDPKAEECKVCGDCEICAIVYAQKLHIKRNKIEDKQSFKDVQNIECSWKDLSKCIRLILKKKKSLPVTQVKTLATKKLKIHESQFDLLIKEVALKSKKIKLNNKILSL